MSKKIIVTGAAGFVGRNLLPLLIGNGHEITAVVKNSKEKKLIEKFPIKIIVCDLAGEDKLDCLKNVEVIVHLASAISSVDPLFFERNNVEATSRLLSCAKRSKVSKIIHFSSAAVTSIRQDDYSRTKKVQEELVKNSSIPYVVLRPSMIYGPSDDKNVGWLISIVRKFPVIPLPGNGNFGRQPVYVTDICKVVLKLVEDKRQNKVYEIHGYEYITLRQMIKTIITHFRFRKIIVPLPVSLLKVAIFLNQLVSKNPKFTLDQVQSLISGEKFKGDDWAKLFDIIPTKFSEGIKRM